MGSTTPFKWSFLVEDNIAIFFYQIILLESQIDLFVKFFFQTSKKSDLNIYKSVYI